jgi:hypothetical protein
MANRQHRPARPILRTPDIGHRTLFSLIILSTTISNASKSALFYAGSCSPNISLSNLIKIPVPALALRKNLGFGGGKIIIRWVAFVWLSHLTIIRPPPRPLTPGAGEPLRAFLVLSGFIQISSLTLFESWRGFPSPCPGGRPGEGAFFSSPEKNRPAKRRKSGLHFSPLLWRGDVRQDRGEVPFCHPHPTLFLPAKTTILPAFYLT